MDDYAFTEEDYDFVLQNGETHLILSSRERVEHQGTFPADANGSVLVSGSVKLADFETACEVPTTSDSYHPHDLVLSTNHRWLAHRVDERWKLHDLHSKGEEGFVFFLEGDSWKWSIHPDGIMVSTWNKGVLQLHAPDEKILSETAVCPGGAESGICDQTFSGCGKYLWVLDESTTGTHSLLLLEVPSLKVLDFVDATRDPEHAFNWGQERTLYLRVWPDKNVLAVVKETTEPGLTVTFYQAQQGRILRHLKRIYTNGFWEYSGISFHPTRERFAVWEPSDGIHEFSWPDCKPVGSLVPEDVGFLNYDNPEIDEPVAYSDDLLLMGPALEVADSGTLIWRGKVYSRGIGLLANGMILDEGKDSWQVKKLNVKPTLIPVVAIHDNDGDQDFVEILQKKRGNWVSIRESVCWIDTPFSERAED